MIDFLKKTFHIPKFAPGGIIEKPIVDVECDPPEFVVNQERFNEAMEQIRLNEERKTMKQTILKKPLLDDLKGIKETLIGQGDPILASVLNLAIACVEKQPIVDVVEVVRCKECLYYDDLGDYCRIWCGVRHQEHFCGEGERKDNNEG